MPDANHLAKAGALLGEMLYRALGSIAEGEALSVSLVIRWRGDLGPSRLTLSRESLPDDPEPEPEEA